MTRACLTGKALRLGRLLAALLPDPEAMGFLALMLLQESRRTARSTVEGDIIPLEDQDRSLWDSSIILERGDLADYPLLHAARAKLYRRLNRLGEARTAYEQALVLAKQEPDRKFLQQRFVGLG